MYDDIILTLRDGWGTAQFKFWVNKHFKLVKIGETSNLKSIAKRQKIYDDALRKEQYQLGDIVGLKIDKVDRTNTTPRILPCKVVSIQSASDDTVLYKVCTLTGVLSVAFSIHDLLDLSKCNFADLRAVDYKCLPVVTFIQACKGYASTGGNTIAEACNCKRDCATK
ncbi:unnamed protein product, partial [Didymodactylos carnosus]